MSETNIEIKDDKKLFHYKDIIKDEYYIELNTYQTNEINKFINSDDNYCMHCIMQKYFEIITSFYKNKFDENIIYTINEDRKNIINLYITNSWKKGDVFYRIKKVYLFLYIIAKFIIKTYMINFLLNSHGQLVIYNHFYFNENWDLDDKYLKKIYDHEYAKFFLSVFPKNLYTKDEDIYSVNGEFILENTKEYETANIGYNKRMCNIDINYEKLDCNKDCENILKNFQNSGDYTMCYYDVNYNIISSILIYTLPILIIEIYYLSLYKESLKLTYEKIILENKNSDYNKLVYKYLKNNKELIKHKINLINKEVKSQRGEIKMHIFIKILFINFIWSDIINYNFNNYQDNEYIYNNYMLLGEGFGPNLNYENLKIKYNLPECLLWITGCMNQAWPSIIILFIAFIGAKLVFSFANLFKVFKVGFLRPKLFIVGLNIFNPTTFFKPLFWFYFELFINSFILDMLIFKSFNEYINNIKDIFIKLKNYIYKKEKNTNIELPSIPIDINTISIEETKI